MGLFTKKPKNAPAQPAPSARAAGPAETGKAPKGKKVTIGAADFLALRSELTDLRSRLEASEQAKALVETRLAALDATTTAIAHATGPAGSDEIRVRVNELQQQLGVVAEAAAAANAQAENAAAKATAAATVASNVAAAPPQVAPVVADIELIARVDALAERLDAAQATPPAVVIDPALTQQVAALTAKLEATQASTATSAPDPGLLARLDQLSARLDATPEASQLAALEARVGELAATATVVDGFGAQLAQLNARVSAQAEFGAQLGSLRDRITELQNDTDARRTAALAATGEADLRDRVNAIADRLGVGDDIAAQIAQLAERVAASDATTRQATEQVSAIEQRLQAVSTELANQVSELGRDIDGLAAHQGDAAQGIVSDELLDGLRSAQVKLAAEQARYEIAFRQDLAALAEQVRHSHKT